MGFNCRTPVCLAVAAGVHHPAAANRWGLFIGTFRPASLCVRTAPITRRRCLFYLSRIRARTVAAGHEPNRAIHPRCAQKHWAHHREAIPRASFPPPRPDQAEGPALFMRVPFSKCFHVPQRALRALSPRASVAGTAFAAPTCDANTCDKHGTFPRGYQQDRRGSGKSPIRGKGTYRASGRNPSGTPSQDGGLAETLTGFISRAGGNTRRCKGASALMLDEYRSIPHEGRLHHEQTRQRPQNDVHA